jgi:hypothetical protein
MPFKKSDNWETKWYGSERAVLLVDVEAEWEKTQITYETYSHGLLGTCEQCKVQDETVKIEHMNTAYSDDYKNYVCLCDRCREEINAYWQERWDDLDADLRAGLDLGGLSYGNY